MEPVKNLRGEVISEKHDVLNGWKEYFENLLNRDDPADKERTRDVHEARTLEAKVEARTLEAEAEARTIEAKVEAKAEFIQFWPSEL